LPVTEIMIPIVYSVESVTAVSEAVHIMNRNRVGSLLVLENNKLIGIMTERDILKRIVEPKADPEKVKVREITSTPLITVQKDASIEDAARIMVEKGVKRLPILTVDGSILGIVSMTDLVRSQPALHALLPQLVKREYAERQKVKFPMFFSKSDLEGYRQHAKRIESLQELLVFEGEEKKGAIEKAAFPEVSTFADEIKTFSDKIKVSIRSFDEDVVAKTHGVNRAPAVQIRTQDGYTLTWYGVPTRLLLHPFIDSIIIFSRKETTLPEEIVQKILSLKREGHIMVLAASSSPLCWHTISIVTQFAVLNKKIKCDIVDILQFPALIEEYHVLSVPNVIVNERHELVATCNEPHLPEILLRLLS